MQEGARQPRSLRTRVYVDGYNFYYGCLKGTHHKWLDLYKLFQEHVLPSALIERDGQYVRSELLTEAVQFFTATIIERAAKAHDSVSPRRATTLRCASATTAGSASSRGITP
ncbi:NYN domain-containing protein [Ralstonia solanacearum]|uniref:NYN domain-containing protein n=1 Tax=Ralstonia solanacearum TaxID=305 RepID=UPI00018167F8|nr:NYN domain-containing protein [Ralstonia solanacearum]MDC6179624.1 NYN domain-containing protein [Ralstonia solanacearum]MDC6212228.1 NYN domain-containing protein [Ralstonia solanacearum]MDC6241140.1 NYN domain-containing protein [Ralstonia solanacearum]MDD7802715.1 NYN domain-containing protein [Ralstonia solanacearum]